MKTAIRIDVQAVLTMTDGTRNVHDAVVAIDTSATDLEQVEVDAVASIIAASPRDVPDIDAITLDWRPTTRQLDRPEVMALLQHLIRNRARYRFGPDRRGALESRIAARAALLPKNRDVETQPAITA